MCIETKWFCVRVSPEFLMAGVAIVHVIAVAW